MKRCLCVLIAAVMLCLSACGSPAPGASTEMTAATETGVAEKPLPPLTGETELIEEPRLPLPEETAEFSFLSGAGGWRTVMTLNADGSFAGRYLDSEMGEIGDGYPKGSVYLCDFTGRFENFEKINEYSWRMTLTEIKTEREAGEEWIEDEIRYVASGPHGLNDPISMAECTEFIFYLPDTPVDQVPEGFLAWWPYRYSQETEPRTTLSCYGILNVATEFGFFTVG